MGLHRKAVKGIEDLATDRLNTTVVFKTSSPSRRRRIDKVSLDLGWVRRRANVCWAALSESVSITRTVEAMQE